MRTIQAVVVGLVVFVVQIACAQMGGSGECAFLVQVSCVDLPPEKKDIFVEFVGQRLAIFNGQGVRLKLDLAQEQARDLMSRFEKRVAGLQNEIEPDARVLVGISSSSKGSEGYVLIAQRKFSRTAAIDRILGLLEDVEAVAKLRRGVVIDEVLAILEQRAKGGDALPLQ